MKIKTVNNRNSIIGGIIGYVILTILFSVGLYIKQYSYAFLIIGFIVILVVTFLGVRKIKSIEFYSQKLIIKGPFCKPKTVDVTNHAVQLYLIGGSIYIPSYTVALMIDGDKITNFRLNNLEWEFEEFYHNTQHYNYFWRIHEGQKSARAKDYELFLERRKIKR